MDVSGTSDEFLSKKKSMKQAGATCSFASWRTTQIVYSEDRGIKLGSQGRQIAFTRYGIPVLGKGKETTRLWR